MNYIIQNANLRTIRTCLLVKIGFASGTVYWTNAFTTIITNASTQTGSAPAATWTPRGFKVGGITGQQGQESGSVSLEIADADNYIAAILLGGASLVGTVVEIYEAWLNPNNATVIATDSVGLFYGSIQQPQGKRTGTDQTMVFTLTGGSDLQSKPMPRRKWTQTCDVTFKGVACGYSGGATSCDHTLASCTALANKARYGGFVYLIPAS